MQADSTRRDGFPIDLSLPSPTHSFAATVALVSGHDDRADNLRRAMDLVAADFEVTVKGKQRIVIKPNFVSTMEQKAATHVDAVRVVLEALRPIVGDQQIVIAESAVQTAARNFGYDDLRKTANVRFVDVDEDDEVAARVAGPDGTQVVKLSKMLVESDCLISVGLPKTHDAVIVTLSLKNIIFTALMRSREKQYRFALHVTRGVHHQAVFELTHLVRPHFAIIDGWTGMEGAGPMEGDPLDWRIALAGKDFLAVDTLTTALMGFNPADIGYLRFCKEAGLGEGDLAHIRVVGDEFNACLRRFKPHPAYEWQLGWKEYFDIG